MFLNQPIETDSLEGEDHMNDARLNTDRQVDNLHMIQGAGSFGLNDDPNAPVNMMQTHNYRPSLQSYNNFKASGGNFSDQIEILESPEHHQHHELMLSPDHDTSRAQLIAM